MPNRCRPSCQDNSKRSGSIRSTSRPDGSAVAYNPDTSRRKREMIACRKLQNSKPCWRIGSIKLLSRIPHHEALFSSARKQSLLASCRCFLTLTWLQSLAAPDRSALEGSVRTTWQRTRPSFLCQHLSISVPRELEGDANPIGI